MTSAGTRDPQSKPGDAVILVIEDDIRNAELTRVMLRIAGYPNMIHAASSKDIQNAIQGISRIDLILLDIQLPGEDGYQIYDRLRRIDLFKTTPIIAVTALVMPDDVTRAEEAGFNGFLGKPFNFDRFGHQISAILSGQSVWEAR